MRVLVATDGSRCSEAAVRGMVARPWPEGTEVEVVSVVHTTMPLIPDPTLTGLGMRWTAISEDREDAPRRVAAAAEMLRAVPGLQVSTSVLEGDTAQAIINEAERIQADLIVVGSHGRGAVSRLALGSVSQRVATHAHCSVEISRCRELASATAR